MYNIHKLAVVFAVGLCNIVKVHWYLTRLRIYGIKQGNNQHSEDSSIGTKLTESDIANQLGIDLNTLKRAKSLTTLPVIECHAAALLKK